MAGSGGFIEWLGKEFDRARDSIKREVIDVPTYGRPLTEAVHVYEQGDYPDAWQSVWGDRPEPAVEAEHAVVKSREEIAGYDKEGFANAPENAHVFERARLETSHVWDVPALHDPEHASDHEHEMER